MNRAILPCVLFFTLSFAAIVSCRKGGNASATNTVFYLSENCTGGQVSISINGQSKSISKIFTAGSIPKCGDANTASFQLTAGTYAYTVTDNNGARSGSVTVAAHVCNSVGVKCDSFSTNIRNVISQDYIDSLGKWGCVIHAGQNPPKNLDGVYLFSPNTLSHRYGPDDSYYIGEVINDYKYKLFNQNNSIINISYKSSSGSDTATGLEGYISGTDNSFTIFGTVTGVSSSIPYTSVLVITGIMTSTGIKNMQHGFVLTGKTGDTYNSVLMPVGGGRVYYDGDYFSETSLSFKPAYSVLNNTKTVCGR